MKKLLMTANTVVLCIFFSLFANAEDLKINRIKSIKEYIALKEQNSTLSNDIKIPSEWKKVTKPAVSISKDEKSNISKKTYKFDDFLKAKWQKNPNIKPSNNIKIKERTKSKNNDGLQSKMENLPTDFRMIGEFEEMQAVCVSIPTSLFGLIDDQFVQLFFDYDFNYIMDDVGEEYNEERTIDVQIPPGCAVYWPWLSDNTNDFNDVRIVGKDLVYNIPDIGVFSNEDGSKDTTTAYLWGKLIYEIQQAGAQAWIRCTATKLPYDTTYIKDYFSKIGYPLTNYKFFTPDVQDAFWMRDFGVFGIYYKDATNKEKLGFLDARYYTGRAFDDEYNKMWMDELGYDYYDLDIKMEGGNIMNDGWKKEDGGFGSYGTVIHAGNSVNYGQYYWSEDDSTWYIEPRQGLSKNQTDTRMGESFNFNPIVLNSLQYDGGTGHIDLWIKQFDEETMLISDMPEKYQNLTDYKIIQQNRATLSTLKSVYGTNYRFKNAPMPRLDNSDMPTNNVNYNADPRSYLNGVTVNKTYIYPSFSFKEGDVNWEYEQQNKAILEKLLPGYRLAPIDARSLTPGGGAIHCITMQIPVNPDSVVTIRHKPIRDYQIIADEYPIEVDLITNRDCSKLNVIAAIWSLNNNNYENIQLTTTDNKHWTGILKKENIWNETDTIRYNIIVLDSDGNDVTKIIKTAPITGPASLTELDNLNNNPTFGYHEFWFNNTSIDQLYNFEPKSNAIESVYPNPAINTSTINLIMENLTNGNISIDIVNSVGQVVASPMQNKYTPAGVWTLDVNIENLVSGAYFIKMQTQNEISIANFVIK